MSTRISITRWFFITAIAAGSCFAVKNAVSQMPDEEDIAVLQPKGGGSKASLQKADTLETKDERIIAGPDPGKEAIKTPLNIREKYKPENVCYVGDSYMSGITDEGDVQLNIFAKNGRPFISRAKKWNGDDIQTTALGALDNPDCRLLVMSGGLNDFHSYHRALGKVVEGLKGAYKDIIRIAEEKNVEVVIFNVPKIPKLPMHDDESMEKRLSRKKEIDEATDEFNAFLLSLKGAHIMDTMAILQSVCKNDGCRIWRKDGIHPGPKGYKALFRSL